ncbi:hypothetical protein AgCh_032214 [Apium graveolens]
MKNDEWNLSIAPRHIPSRKEGDFLLRWPWLLGDLGMENQFLLGCAFNAADYILKQRVETSSPVFPEYSIEELLPVMQPHEGGVRGQRPPGVCLDGRPPPVVNECSHWGCGGDALSMKSRIRGQALGLCSWASSANIRKASRRRFLVGIRRQIVRGEKRERKGATTNPKQSQPPIITNTKHS